MLIFQDYGGRQLVLTDYDERHILDGHYEIGELGAYKVLEETVGSPDFVVRARQALHYYRMYRETIFGDKYVRVVVAEDDEVGYIRTAFITGSVVKGSVIWEKEM